MLPRMNMAEPDPADAASADAPPGPSQTSLDSLASAGKPVAEVEDSAMPRGCPFLLAEGGGWRLDVPSRDHRCAAVSPPAALSLEKQTRLCLTAAHTSCATYLASLSARGARLGIPAPVRATRWGLARTTTVIEDAGGLRARAVAFLLDRRRWPAIPAVILVTTLVVLAVSGLRGGGATPVASRPAVTAGPTLRPSAAPTGTTAPESTPTSAPSAAPSPTPVASTGPVATFRTYKVKPGDSLSAIANQFNTTSRAIADLNGIRVSATLRIGQILKIPNPPS
jgi:LysM repeat protein